MTAANTLKGKGDAREEADVGKEAKGQREGAVATR